MADTIITEPFYPCEDVWPPGTLTKPVIAAYKLLADRKQIEIERVFYNRQTDVTRFKYRSIEWGEALKASLRNALKEANVS